MTSYLPITAHVTIFYELIVIPAWNLNYVLYFSDWVTLPGNAVNFQRRRYTYNEP